MSTSVAVIALIFISIFVSVVAYAGSVTYTYDDLNRLTKAEYEDGRVIQYTYDAAGNRTATYDSTTPPITTADPQGGLYSSASVTLTCGDFSGTGCDKTYYTTDGTTPTTQSPVYSSPINISETTTLKFFSTDLASNSETVKTQTYTIDSTAPTGTITINSGAASTDSVNVTLTLTCDDAQGCSQMKFSNDVDNDANYSTPETYSATKAWALSPGAGTKTVYSKFKDAPGNWSTAYSDTINLTTDSYTKSLLHMNGTDGSTTFTDNATGGTHTWTAYGNAQIDTAQSKFGGASVLFDGNGDYIGSADSADWTFGTGDFTIDFWVKINDLTTYQTLYSHRADTNNRVEIFYYGALDDSIRIIAKSGGGTIMYYNTTTGISDTNWHHIALVRNGTVFYIFFDGVSQTLTVNTAIGSSSMPDVAGQLWIGGYNGGTYWYNGWLDEYRISKGIARWTANFTPPFSEY
jgi:YD repeat-containing protein